MQLKRFVIILITLKTLTTTAQVNYFVSNTGNDANSGSLEKPFKTIQQALNKSIAAKRKNVIINLRKGIFYLNNTIVLTASAYKNLTITAYKNEKVVIAGSQEIKPLWQVYKGNILQAKIDLENIPDRLFMNGKALPMARYPNYDSSARVFNGTADDAISKEKVKQWAAPSGAYVHALHGGEWGGFHYQIVKKVTEDSLQLVGGWQNNRPSPMHKKYRFVENVFEELDAPGEWYYDKIKKILYLYPPQGININVATFTIGKLNELIGIKGSTANPVKNIRIAHISFTQTARTFMLTREALLRTDWAIYRGGAVLLDGTENISISNCNFYETGGNAIFVNNYNKNVNISNNHIHNIGGSAICFVGNQNAVRSPAVGYYNYVDWDKMDYTPGPMNNDYPQQCKAENNLIHHTGKIEKQSAGVEIDIASDILISHNTLYNLPRAGINIGDGCFGGNIIEYNDVFNTVLETGDHGAFNSWGRDRFWRPQRNIIDSIVAAKPGIQFLDIVKPNVIRNNRFHCEHGWDIDLDDGSSNYIIENNVCLSGGLKLREGYKRIVQNNILINNTFHPHVWLANSEDVFKHNIVSKKYAPIGLAQDRWGSNIDSNIFVAQSTLEAMQKLSIDKNSITASPEFVNAAKGDYSSRSTLISKVGFKNFPMEFGVTDPYLKSIAAKSPMKILLNDEVNLTSKTAEWKGAIIKNIETLGERSAAGLNDEKGILIVEVKKGSLAFTSGLQSGDVIIRLNDQPTDRMPVFLEITDSNNWRPSLNAVIVRNQSEKTITLLLK